MSIGIKVGNIGKLFVEGKKHLSICVDLDEEQGYAKFYVVNEDFQRIYPLTLNLNEPISFSATRNVLPALRKKLLDLFSEYVRIKSIEKKIEEEKARLDKAHSKQNETIRWIAKLAFGYSQEDLQGIVDCMDIRGYSYYIYKNTRTLCYEVVLSKEVFLEKYAHNTYFGVLLEEEYDGTYQFIRNTSHRPYNETQKKMFDKAIHMGRSKVIFLPLSKKYPPREDLGVGDKISLYYSVEYTITIPKTLKDIKQIKKFLTKDIWKN